NAWSDGMSRSFFFFFQAEDGIRDWSVTGVQTCALPIYVIVNAAMRQLFADTRRAARADLPLLVIGETGSGKEGVARAFHRDGPQIGRASCRERGEMSVVAVSLKKKR